MVVGITTKSGLSWYNKIVLQKCIHSNDKYIKNTLFFGKQQYKVKLRYSDKISLISED